MTLNSFPGIPVKIYKILGKFMDFQSCLMSISSMISNAVHGGVCVDIFWNSPLPFVNSTKGLILDLTKILLPKCLVCTYRLIAKVMHHQVLFTELKSSY